MESLIKAVGIIGIISLVTLTCFAFINFFVPTFLNILMRLGSIKDWRIESFSETPKEHTEQLGIEIVKLPSQEEQELHLIIRKVTQAELDYWSTGKDKEFESIKDYFLSEEYERLNSEISSRKESYRIHGIPVPFRDVKILRIEFSKPRRYREIRDRIGIITYISETEPLDALGGFPRNIFIFKRANGKWKIEKKWEVMLRLDVDEEALIQSYFTD